jgi:hypothetical protein
MSFSGNSSRVNNYSGTRSAGSYFKKTEKPLDTSNSNTNIKYYTWTVKDVISWFNITKKQLYNLLIKSQLPMLNVGVYIDGKAVVDPKEVQEIITAVFDKSLAYNKFSIHFSTNFISENKDINKQLKELQ